MPDWTYGVTFAAGFVSGGVCAVAIIAWRIERLVWYCPECGDGPAPRGFKHLRGDDGGDTICPGTHVKCVVIPPGTPLPVILDTLGVRRLQDVHAVLRDREKAPRNRRGA
jgi:hypothetical protein